MDPFFFSGSTYAKLDEKNRFVLPQHLRYGLVEEGKLEFSIALGLGGSLAIYRKSVIAQIIQKFKEKQYVARYQKFFTLFFSTLHHLSPDKLGRVVLPSVLKKSAGIEKEMVICGVLNRIEIWSKERYDKDLQAFLTESNGVLGQIGDEMFGLLDESSKVEQNPSFSPSEEKGNQESVSCPIFP